MMMFDPAGGRSDASELLDSDLADGGVIRPDPASVYMSIISEQTFIGCWKLNVELSQLLDISLDQLRDAAPVKVSYVNHL